ncbi:MAG: hypothetical protein ACTH8J_01505, partial [Specibacter sp.]
AGSVVSAGGAVSVGSALSAGSGDASGSAEGSGAAGVSGDAAVVPGSVAAWAGTAPSEKTRENVSNPAAVNEPVRRTEALLGVVNNLESVAGN